MASCRWLLQKGLRLCFAVLTGASLLSEAMAGDGPAQFPGPTGAPYCATNEFYGPDGMITKVGERTFRLCSPTSGPPEERMARVVLNAATVPGLANPTISYGLMLDSRLPLSVRKARVIDGLTKTGMQMFGDVEYLAYNGAPPGPNGRHGMDVYVSNSEKITASYVICFGEDDFPNYGKSVSCESYMEYKGIVVQALRYFKAGEANAGLVPFEKMLPLPSDILRVLAVADVTESVETWEARLPIVP